MPVGIAAGALVAGWGAGTVVTAIAVGVVNGALVGAAIGAATSLVKGGNILEGALKGALVGGVTGGALNGALEGLSSVAGIGPGGFGVTEATMASDIAKEGGGLLNAVGEAGRYVDAAATGGLPGAGSPGGGPTLGQTMPTGLSPEAQATWVAQQGNANTAAIMNQGMKTQAMLTGTQALATTAAQVLLTKDKPTPAQEQADIAANNRPGQFTPTSAKLAFNGSVLRDTRLPPVWAKLINPQDFGTSVSAPLSRANKPGLLGGAA